MATITTLAAMRDYCKLMLGAPVINIELADTQIDQIIENELDVFSRYAYEEGNYEDYIIFTASAGVSDYPLSGVVDTYGNPITDILHVYDYSNNNMADGINVMFSPTHILLAQQYYAGGYPGGPNVQNGVPSMVMSEYSVAMMYLKDVQQTFGKMYKVRYLHNGILKVVPTPQQDIRGVLTIYRKVDPVYLYNHPHVKKLCVAAVKILWGEILSKYVGTLPDGLTINGEAIKSEGKEEYQVMLDTIRAEAQPCEFFIG